MFGSSHRDLEARVARLERLLKETLALVREIQAERGGSGEPAVPDEAEAAIPQAPSPQPPGPQDRPEPFLDPPRGPEPDLEAPRREPEPPLRPAAGRTTEGREGVGAEAADRSFQWQDLLAPDGPWLSRLGIVLLLLSVAFFFKYSIDQGWVTPGVRLVIGLLTGAVLLFLGFRGASKGEHLGTALSGGAIATFFITGYAAHQWYSLASYPAAFGLLVGTSALGIALSMVSGRQTLAFVGLIGALATPILLSSPDPRVGGLVVYLCLVVGSVAVVYMARAWRILFIVAAAGSWPLLAMAAANVSGESGLAGRWMVQGGILFSALVFWLVPLARAVLRAGDPDRWPRPHSPRGEAWSVHLDALSLIMPGIAVFLSGLLWELSRDQVGWVLFAAALLAQGVGWIIALGEDPEDSASTQRFVSILLSTVGLGLVLPGNVLYLAFIAEAAALFAVGIRKESRPLLVLGGMVEFLVLVFFLARLAEGESLLQGDMGFVLDLAALGGAVFIGSLFEEALPRKFFFAVAYLGLMVLMVEELHAAEGLLYLAFITLLVGSRLLASRKGWSFLGDLGHLPALAILGLLSQGWERGESLITGEVLSLADLAGIAGLAWAGTRINERELRLLYLFGAYVLLLAWTARELAPLQQGQPLTTLAFGVQGTILLVAGRFALGPLVLKTGMATLLFAVGKLLIVDLAAVEPIWRVLLFSLFGVLFLVLSKVTGGDGAGGGESKGAGDPEGDSS